VIATVAVAGEFIRESLIFGGTDNYANHLADKATLFLKPGHP